MRNIWMVVGIVTLLSITTGTKAQSDASKPEFYTAKVKPILDSSCGRCHEADGHRGGLNFDTKESFMQGGHHGPVVVPGDPENSVLLKMIHQGDGVDHPMPPPPRPKLSDADIATIEKWIKSGAVMP